MNLRHIRPRSVEWYDALVDEVEKGSDRLSPEEVGKLRAQSDGANHLIGAPHPIPVRRAPEHGRAR